MGKLYMDRPIRRWGLSWAQRRPRKAKPRSEAELAAEDERMRLERENAEFWEHPEAEDQRKVIEAKYGPGKPVSIADYWNR